MIIDIYDTTLCGHFLSSKNIAEQALLRHIAIQGKNSLTYSVFSTTTGTLLVVTGKTVEEQDLPVFKFPILSKTTSGETIMFVDIRSTMRSISDSDIVDSQTILKYVRDKIAFEFYIMQAALTLSIMGRDKIATLYKFIIKSMTWWIVNAITYAYSLDGDEKEILYVIVMNSVILTIEEDTDDMLKKHIIETNAIFGRIEPLLITNIMSQIENKGGAIVMTKNIANGPLKNRLTGFNFTTLSAVLDRTMFGAIFKDNMLVAIEHIPTWLTIVYTIYTTRFYQKTQLYTLLKNSEKAFDTTDAIAELSRRVSKRDDMIIGAESFMFGGENSYPIETTVIKEKGKTKNVVPTAYGSHTLIVRPEKGVTIYELYIGAFNNIEQNLALLQFKLRSRREGDRLLLNITSSGGSLWEGMALHDTFKSLFKNEIVGYLSMHAMSMGAILFCSLDKRIIHPNSVFMLHDYSLMIGDNGGNLQGRAGYAEALYGSFIYKVLVGNKFLTEDEFKDLKNGKQMYITPRELCVRNIATHVNVEGTEMTATEYLNLLDTLV